MFIRLAFEELKGDTNRLTFAHNKEIETLIREMPDGSVVVHQIEDHPKHVCEYVSKMIAGNIDLALWRVYEKEFLLNRSDREIKGKPIIGGEPLDLQQEMCG